MRRIRKAAVTSLATLAATAVVTTTASPAAVAAPASSGLDKRNNNTSAKLREAASAAGGYQHLEAFQAIADANGDTRASGTPGYDASVDYVVERLRAAGYRPTVQAFEFPFFQSLTPATLTAGGEDVETGAFTYSGAGEVTGTIVPVQLTLPPTAPAGGTDSGCSPEAFEDVDLSGDSDIALIQRGTCTFGEKAFYAEEAGAEAVIIMNEGQEGRTDLLIGTLGEPLVTVPVLGASYADGVALAELAGEEGAVTATADTVSEFRETYNVLAQTSGRTDNVVMVGAHLDSVIEGPGINDNGSGSAGILEVAEAYAKTKPTNAVRFAWWGAEELGLLGSEHYVANLSEDALEDIALYLNFDMIASPNFARMVYDGDDSDGVGEGAGPAGSAQIENLFTGFFGKVGLNSKGTDFSGRSDYGPFIAVGIPSGGLFTGAEGIATAQDAALFGSEPGVAYDPCYHQACDDLSNLDLTVFEQNIDAIAHAVISYGYSTQPVNGVKGSGGAGKTAVSGPGGGQHVAETDTGGGGLHEDHDHEQDSA